MFEVDGGKFSFFAEAIAFARKNGCGSVRNSRSGKYTYVLPKALASCMVCGNELEGRKHCPLCGAKHVY